MGNKQNRRKGAAGSKARRRLTMIAVAQIRLAKIAAAKGLKEGENMKSDPDPADDDARHRQLGMRLTPEEEGNGVLAGGNSSGQQHCDSSFDIKEEVKTEEMEEVLGNGEEDDEESELISEPIPVPLLKNEDPLGDDDDDGGGVGRCLVCFKEVPRRGAGSREYYGGRGRAFVVDQPKLYVLFILKRILEISDFGVEGFLELDRDPNKWIMVCEGCQQTVHDFMDVNDKIVEELQKLKGIRKRIISKMKRSYKNSSSNSGSDDEDDERPDVVVTNATRKFVKNRNYEKSVLIYSFLNGEKEKSAVFESSARAALTKHIASMKSKSKASKASTGSRTNSGTLRPEAQARSSQSTSSHVTTTTNPTYAMMATTKSSQSGHDFRSRRTASRSNNVGSVVPSTSNTTCGGGGGAGGGNPVVLQEEEESSSDDEFEDEGSPMIISQSVPEVEEDPLRISESEGEGLSEEKDELVVPSSVPHHGFPQNSQSPHTHLHSTLPMNQNVSSCKSIQDFLSFHCSTSVPDIPRKRVRLIAQKKPVSVQQAQINQPTGAGEPPPPPPRAPLLNFLKTYKCSICPTGEFEDIRHFASHIVFHQERPYKCSTCHVFFPNEESIHEEHWKKLHTPRGPETYFEFLPVSLLSLFKCYYCTESFHTDVERDEHANWEHRVPPPIKPFNCKLCMTDFPKDDELMFHKALVHPEVVKYGCTRCDKIFKKTTSSNDGNGVDVLDECNLRQHLSTDHPSSSSSSSTITTPIVKICPLCGIPVVATDSTSNSSTNPKQIKNHLQSTHHQFVHLVYPCQLCPAIFQSSESLKQHGEDHPKFTTVVEDQDHDDDETPLWQEDNNMDEDKVVEATPYQFQVAAKVAQCWCGKVFDSLKLLKTHKARQHPKSQQRQSYMCDICGWTTCSSNSHLTRHKYSAHQIVTPDAQVLECQSAGCTYKTVSGHQLSVHSRQHLPVDERPLGCSTCGKKFSNSTKLKVHEQIHTNASSKPYQCELCGASFAVRNYLYIHKRLTHEKRVFPSTNKKKSPVVASSSSGKRSAKKRKVANKSNDDVIIVPENPEECSSATPS